jgi:hypothetical protein
VAADIQLFFGFFGPAIDKSVIYRPDSKGHDKVA